MPKYTNINMFSVEGIEGKETNPWNIDSEALIEYFLS